MEAEISRKGDITIITLRGHLNFESTEPFRKNFLSRILNEKVVFNLQELSFVGSSGITLFIDVLSDFCKKSSLRPKFCCVGSEFKRIFATSALAQTEFYESFHSALLAFENLSQSQQTFIPDTELQGLFDSDDVWVEDGELETKS